MQAWPPQQPSAVKAGDREEKKRRNKPGRLEAKARSRASEARVGVREVGGREDVL